MFSTGVPSEQFRGSASCLWKMNLVCIYQKHDRILKSCARNIRLKFLIEFFTVCMNNFRDWFQVKTLFFFFREHPDFGIKIGVFSRLRPANSNNFEKLDHPGIRQSNYRTGAPQASGMFHWGSAPPKRLKTTALSNFEKPLIFFLLFLSVLNFVHTIVEADFERPLDNFERPFRFLETP